MDDEPMAFALGTFVWAKLKSKNKIWWPGKVVCPSTLPKALEKYNVSGKRVLAIVGFETDSTYEIVYKMANILLYSCTKKMEFLKTGYSLYLKQKKNNNLAWSCNMENFINDVTIIEKEIAGEIDIFHQFEAHTDYIPPPANIKELFMTEKEKKMKEKKMKEKNMKSLLTKPLVPKKKKPKTNNASTSQQTSQTIYKCIKSSCTYSTIYLSNINRHISRHFIDKTNSESSSDEDSENENAVHTRNPNVSETIVSSQVLTESHSECITSVDDGSRECGNSRGESSIQSTNDNGKVLIASSSSQTPEKRVYKNTSSNKKMKLQDDISTECGNSRGESTIQSTNNNGMMLIASSSSSQTPKKRVYKKTSYKTMKLQDNISTECGNSRGESAIQSTNDNGKMFIASSSSSSSQTPQKRVYKKTSYKKMKLQDNISTECGNSRGESTIQSTNNNGNMFIASTSSSSQTPKKRVYKKTLSSKEVKLQNDTSTKWGNRNKNTNKNIARASQLSRTQNNSQKVVISQDDISTEWENSEDENENVTSTSQALQNRVDKKKPSNKKVVSQDDLHTEWELSDDEESS